MPNNGQARVQVAMSLAEFQKVAGRAVAFFRSVNRRHPKDSLDLAVFLQMTGERQALQMETMERFFRARAAACVMGEGRGI